MATLNRLERDLFVFFHDVGSFDKVMVHFARKGSGPPDLKTLVGVWMNYSNLPPEVRPLHYMLYKSQQENRYG